MSKFIGRHLSLRNLSNELKYYGVNAAQVFTKAPQQWYGGALPFKTINYNREKYYVCAHAGYLINLANRNSPSKDAILKEAIRCSQLGIPDMVVHPGSGDVEDAIKSLIEISSIWPEDVTLLVENTAGQGKYIGSTIEELRHICNCLIPHMPIGICFDTAHAFGAGIGFSDIADKLIKLIHLNDSAVPKGSKKDRHANIGLGYIDSSDIKHIVEMATVPIIMETPENRAIEDIELVRRLIC